MKIRKEYIILLILIAAISVYLALRNPDRTHYQLPKVGDMNAAEVSKIEIDKGANSIVLNKKGSGWEISPQGYAADTAKVKTMLDMLKDLTLTALVSETKDYNRYDLSEDNKIRIRAWASQDLVRDLEVGKAASTYRHTFVKLAGDDRVYHARGNFRGDVDVKVDDLRDKTVLSFDQGEIREISIAKGDESVSLSLKEVPPENKNEQEKAKEGASPVKAKTIWEDADGKKGDQKAITDILADLSNLKCEKYLEGGKEDLKGPIYKISLKGNKTYELSIFDKKEKDEKAYPAASSDNDYPFLLTAWRTDKIMKGPKELLEKPATEEKSQDKPEKTKKD